MNQRARGPLTAFPTYTFSFSTIDTPGGDVVKQWTVIADGLTAEEAQTRARHGLYTALAASGWLPRGPGGGIRLDLTWNAAPLPDHTGANVLDLRGYEEDEDGEPLPSRYPTLEVVTFRYKEPGRWTAHLTPTIHVYDIEVEDGEMGLFRRNAKTASYLAKAGEWDTMRLFAIKAAGLSETYNKGFLRDCENLRRHTEGR